MDLPWLSKFKSTFRRRPRLEPRSSDSEGLVMEGNSVPRVDPHPTGSAVASAMGLDDKPFLLSLNREPHAPSVKVFPNAQGFIIHQQNINLNAVQNPRYPQSVFDLGAFHNSDERCDAPKCHPETRIAVQDGILSWITAGCEYDQPKKIMWLTGPAGTGKSAIAGSVADACQARGILAASFFFSSFSGSTNRRSKRCLVATLAYQLSRHQNLCTYGGHLLRAIEEDPSVFGQCLRDQVEGLILAPLRQAYEEWDISTLPKIIVVDGVDEVEAIQYHDGTRQEARRTDDEDQLEILRILLLCAEDLTFPFRILVVSRPEPAIEDFFTLEAQALSSRIFLDSKYDPDADIELFLNAKFVEIRRKSRLSSAWPSPGAIRWIVEKASGQFIFASTVIRFVTDPSNLPQLNLERVLRLQVGGGKENPFDPLDSLYMHIIKSSPRPKQAALWILCVYFNVGRPVRVWKPLLESVEGEFNYVLGNLTSLLSLPPPEDGESSPFHIYHKSFPDFLSDKNRSGDSFVDFDEVADFWAGRFIRVLKNKGPCLPPPLGRDTETFLFDVLTMGLQFHIGAPIFLPFKYGLQFSLEEIASCDAAWWIQFLLLRDRLTVQEEYAQILTLALYNSVHSECEIWDPAVGCNVACKHWTKHFLLEAKRLNWCVHELELMGRRPESGDRYIKTGAWDDYFMRRMPLGQTCPTCTGPISILDA